MKHLHARIEERILDVMKRYAVWAILLLSFFGLADSAYLAQHEAAGTPLICNIQSLSGCNVVAQSPYAKVFGIPLADFGLLFYGALFIFAALELVYLNRFFRRALQIAALIGVLDSLYFTYLQVYRIQALCIYCLASAIITICILIAAARIEPVRFRRRALLHEA